MQYTDKVLEHFMNPRNIGEIPDADGAGTIGSEECGDMIRGRSYRCHLLKKICSFYFCCGIGNFTLGGLV